MNQSGSEDHTGEFLRGVNYGGRRVGCEFLTGSETPAHTHSPDPGVRSGLHVHIRVSDIDNLLFRDLWNISQNLIHNRGIGFDRLAVALAENLHEVIFTEKVTDEFLRAVLILVGGDSEAHSPVSYCLQHFGDAVIGSGAIAFVSVVIGNEI